MQYYIGRNGQQSGPFSVETVREKVAAGEIAPTDLVWCEGMAAWQPLRDVLDLGEPSPPAGEAVVPPPIPGAPVLPVAEATAPAALASPGARLAAQLINAALLVLTFLPLAPTFFRLQEEGRFDQLYAHVQAGVEVQQSREEINVRMMEEFTALMREFPPAAILASNFLFYALLAAQSLLLAVRGQSIGKLITRVKVVQFGTNARAGFLRAVIRRVLLPFMIIMLLTGVPYAVEILLLTNYLMVFRADRRCLHDIVAGTHVIRA